ncbi:N6-L-threonylcarbamoyladenine synthase [Entomoplasma freundtii]|uniref:tRNA N6-adenosine threonylcarbamoyltransferase n=1 Tax=Entomoplasma freundtii TaxID=74700 RepID=A0A2K8NS89_9MOLU|nr:tRNA (adenosine(37)-N6)-threonylcarbamoyltransferase complex transferase subunit TsaD [Entomoplasma freundtii]ATZ16637.1 tRNA N6-adenosine(37)-threonylcarbamoyltransferase complex transferase subunit TsaD [Entomoplasma freundtii]TDY58196.1 N6-L-threonylcarbamoyladenine synthase [Entomoplasma freundtii]
MKILAIESSCDELSFGLVEDGIILANVISSQIKNHEVHGGVIPELAARLHLENMPYVFEELNRQTHLDWKKVDYIAYTANPGLLGSLMIGKIIAETLALYLGKPLMPLNHLEGHIYGATIDQNFAYPLLALVVSGGHTQIELVKDVHDFKIIGATLDDAIGECYDKVARIIGFPYPGGPEIDRLAQKGNPNRYSLPLAKNDQSYDFSYSGLKTAAINLYRREQSKPDFSMVDFCASFQKAATEVLVKKLETAIIKYQPKTLIIAGGASANSKLRQDIVHLGEKYQLAYTLVPSLQYCTDNGAMMAKLAWEKLQAKK